MDYLVNALMHSTWEAAQDRLDSCRPGPELRRVVRAGLCEDSGRIYLSAYASRRKEAAAGMDRWSAERWVNDVHLESALPASDPGWRTDVLSQAVNFVREILPGFAALASGAAQAVVGLQSAPSHENPDSDVPVGSVHLYQLDNPGDDARAEIESFAQPLLVVTFTSS
ncbi:MAG: hypothetical protein LBV34_22005 [Nocardiopsaceae bacterium]|nr:hypothetical protein [Nocardiopsaceae bacterium]